MPMREEFPVEPGKMIRTPTHPGVFFALDILPEFRARQLTVREIAELLGTTRQTLHRVMTGKTAVTADMAVRLGKLCGNGPHLWLAMQAQHDAWEARRRLGAVLKAIPTLREEGAFDAAMKRRRERPSKELGEARGMNLRRTHKPSRRSR
jgi:antitoxin HigA-1